MTGVQSSLGRAYTRRNGEPPSTPQEIRSMAAALFHREDDPWLCVRLSEVKPNIGEALVILGEQEYGKLAQNKSEIGG